MNTIKYIFLLFFLHLNIYALDSIENLNLNIIIHKSGYFKTSENLSPQEAYNHAISNGLTSLPKDAKSFGLTNETMLFLSYFKTRDIHRNIATRKSRIFSCRMILTNGKHVNFVNLKNS